MIWRMKQISLAEAHNSYSIKPQRTRKQMFLEEMHRVVPWQAIEALIEVHYPKAQPHGGRRAMASCCHAAHLLLAAMVWLV